MNDSGDPVRPKKRVVGKSKIAKRSVVVDGCETSVGLEPQFWEAFKEIAATRKMDIKELVSEVAKDRETANLSSAIRLYVLNFYRDA
jgi:predicted DNA-binding ribbon-helix-helix protein